MKVKAIITETPQHIEIVFTGISDMKRKKIEELLKNKTLKLKV
jgi:ATP:corrinoid adenosyltransferase